MKYDDILNLPHYEPKNHPRMSIESRSAQFAPFKALTGYKESIIETGRIVDKQKELSIDEKEILNLKFLYLKDNLNSVLKSKIIYFIPDKKKKGGIYATKFVKIKKIDLNKREIVLDDSSKILLEHIYNIEY